MKSFSILALFLLFLTIGSNAQLENTTWLHEVNGEEYFIEFQDDLLILGMIDNSDPLLVLSYEIKADSLFLYSKDSSSYCAINTDVTYLLNFTDYNANMHISSLEDPCFERNAFLTGASWEPYITEPEGDLNYVVIRIYMDRIEVNGERNPQALYITDLDGNQVLSAHRQDHVDLDILSSGEYTLQVWDQGKVQWVKNFYWE